LFDGAMVRNVVRHRIRRLHSQLKGREMKALMNEVKSTEEIENLEHSDFATWLQSCPAQFAVDSVDMGGTRAVITFWTDDNDNE
jgi:hypothetical protein